MDKTSQGLDDAFGLVVNFTLKEGHAEAFDQLMRETVDGIRQREPGTLTYVVQTVEGEPLRRVFYELYADLEAFQHHERQPHTVRFLEAREQHVTETVVDRLGVVTAAGVSGS
jgi:quinol monooxygenase YgiN